MDDLRERIRCAIDFVEERLFQELPLAAIAEHIGCSPWHFHRVFVSMTGDTPATYVWKRRVSEICRRLIETREPLVEIALDCGFESQATLTRAFTRHVGVSPGRFRRMHPHSLPAYLHPRLDLDALAERQRRMATLEARVVRMPALQVIGMAGRFTPASASRIPEQWGRFAPRIGEIPRRQGAHTLGLCMNADSLTANEPCFTYVSGVEVRRGAAVPDGMASFTVPANTYAVLTHRGHLSALPDTVKHVWGSWLPASGYRHVSAPDFELYDPSRWNPGTGDGEVDLYVPITDR